MIDYTEMTDEELIDEVCGLGGCSAFFSKRKNDCPFYHANGSGCNAYMAVSITDLRETLIEYLETEKAAL